MRPSVYLLIRVCMAEQGFDEETGDPKHAVEMESWPYHNLLLKKSFSSKHSRRCEAHAHRPRAVHLLRRLGTN